MLSTTFRRPVKPTQMPGHPEGGAEGGAEGLAPPPGRRLQLWKLGTSCVRIDLVHGMFVVSHVRPGRTDTWSFGCLGEAEACAEGIAEPKKE